MQFIGQFEKRSRKRIVFFLEQTKSNATVLHDPVAADCLEKVINFKTGGVLYQKVRLWSRPPREITFKNAWKVQQVGTEIGCGTGDDNS